ncbi:unnamed protein product [Lactuca saligna]|uniref:Uncharacterized protein n=1 Tax=Lactuca saligna TaxID=75948 RepID=A0AA35Y3B1_LACSI|nr:unnamed protein product [Lactuca saligna]
MQSCLSVILLSIKAIFMGEFIPAWNWAIFAPLLFFGFLLGVAGSLLDSGCHWNLDFALNRLLQERKKKKKKPNKDEIKFPRREEIKFRDVKLHQSWSMFPRVLWTRSWRT